ncbi:MAG: hypothetical protein NT062_13730 [Proteobacteria bacterium]|nr:hypothetical protein [Pseudomonadota bacterium]
MIDKTCDFGGSWSGSLAITNGSDYTGAAMIMTSKGMVAAARNLRDAQSRPLSLISLAP